MTDAARLLTGLIFAAALLYSSVDHGGASSYIAVMALVGVLPEVMRPAALIFNFLFRASPPDSFSVPGWGCFPA